MQSRTASGLSIYGAKPPSSPTAIAPIPNLALRSDFNY